MTKELSRYIDRLIEYSAKPAYLQEMEAAKREFFHPEEHVFEDDRAFERRMALFFDWYIFERKLSKKKKTPLEAFMDDHAGDLSSHDKELYHGFLGNTHSLFEVLKNSRPTILVRDLFTKNKHNVYEEDNPLIFQEGFLFEGRILSWMGKECFSGAFCFHPPDVKKLLVKELKKVRKSKSLDIAPLLRSFFLIAVRYERYKHVHPVTIYKDSLVQLAGGRAPASGSSGG